MIKFSIDDDNYDYDSLILLLFSVTRCTRWIKHRQLCRENKPNFHYIILVVSICNLLLLLLLLILEDLVGCKSRLGQDPL